MKGIKTPDDGFRELAAAIINRNVRSRSFRNSEWFSQLKTYTGHENDIVVHIPTRAELFRAGPMPEAKPTKKDIERKQIKETVVENTMIPEFMEFIF